MTETVNIEQPKPLNREYHGCNVTSYIGNNAPGNDGYRHFVTRDGIQVGEFVCLGNAISAAKAFEKFTTTRLFQLNVELKAAEAEVQRLTGLLAEQSVEEPEDDEPLDGEE